MVALHRQPIPARMTAAEFMSWPDDSSGRRWQLIDGEPVAMAPASQRHGAIQVEIAGLLRDHLRSHRPGCRAVITPGVTPRARAEWNCRIPDIAVTCRAEHPQEHLLLEPLLLVEVLSPGNEAATRSNVWAYTTIPSVAEILIVHSLAIKAELLRRLPDGTWPDNPVDLVGPRAELHLDSIGAMFSLASCYANTSLAVTAPPPTEG